MKEMKYCQDCGADIDKRAVICPNCGVPQHINSEQTTNRDAGVAAVLSFIFTGLGQVYNGQILKGLLFMVVQLISLCLWWIGIGVVMTIIVWIIGIYDAYEVAKDKPTTIIY